MLIFWAFSGCRTFFTGYRYEDVIDLFQVVYNLFVLYTLHDMLLIDYRGEGVRIYFLYQLYSIHSTRVLCRLRSSSGHLCVLLQCKYMYFYTVDCSIVPSICISMYIRIIHRLFRSAATSITGCYWRSKPINTTYVYLVRCVLLTSIAWCIALIYRIHGCINNNVKSIVSIATTFVACNVNNAVAVAWLLSTAWFQPVEHRQIVYISPCCYMRHRSMRHLLWSTMIVSYVDAWSIFGVFLYMLSTISIN